MKSKSGKRWHRAVRPCGIGVVRPNKVRPWVRLIGLLRYVIIRQHIVLVYATSHLAIW